MHDLLFLCGFRYHGREGVESSMRAADERGIQSVTSFKVDRFHSVTRSKTWPSSGIRVKPHKLFDTYTVFDATKKRGIKMVVLFQKGRSASSTGVRHCYVPAFHLGDRFVYSLVLLTSLMLLLSLGLLLLLFSFLLFATNLMCDMNGERMALASFVLQCVHLYNKSSTIFSRKDTQLTHFDDTCNLQIIFVL